MEGMLRKSAIAKMLCYWLAGHQSMTSDTPKYRPLERFWPYADLPEQPTDEELAALDPDLHEALFGASRVRSRSRSCFRRSTCRISRARSTSRARRRSIARPAAGATLRYRARFWSSDALAPA